MKSLIGCNAAIMLNHEGEPVERVREYMREFGPHMGKEDRETIIRFISHPIYGPYKFNYAYGRAAAKKIFNK